MKRIGLISDTHGLLRLEVESFLRCSDHIVHAGDICEQGVLDQLKTLAPVTAVRGNNDRGAWAERLPTTEFLEIEGIFLYVIHDLTELDLDPRAAGVHVVVSGHSHKPGVAERDSVLYVNPGSPGPRRFKLPIAAGELIIQDGAVSARVVEF
jgi:uncharacterized protein